MALIHCTYLQPDSSFEKGSVYVGRLECTNVGGHLYTTNAQTAIGFDWVAFK